MKMKTAAALALVAAFGMGAVFPNLSEAKRGENSIIEQLTQEQKAEYKKIMSASRQATADLRKDLEAKQAELQAQLKSETPDTAKIEALSTEIGAIRGKLLTAKVETNIQLKKAGLPTRSLDKKPRSIRKGDKVQASEQEKRDSKEDGAAKQ